MKTMKTWKNVPGFMATELGVTEGKVWDLLGGRLELLDGVITNEESHYELIVHFVANGSYFPARLEPIEKSHPEEWDEERLLQVVEIIERPEGYSSNNNKIIHQLPEDLAKKIFDLYEDEIYDAEVTYEED